MKQTTLEREKQRECCSAEGCQEDLQQGAKEGIEATSLAAAVGTAGARGLAAELEGC